MSRANRAPTGVFVLLLAACGAQAPAPTAPITIETAPAPSGASSPVAAAPSVDGVKLGSPIGELLKRAPYDQPCDVDPIDERKSTLYFWAAGTCRKAPPFPGGTTVAILTPRASGKPHADQAIDLVAWAGGTYFNDKMGLAVHIGDPPDRALKILGAPTRTKSNVQVEKGRPADGHAYSWGRIHALASSDAIVVLAMGDLDISGDGERAQTLERLYHHHLRYSRP